MDHFLVDRKTFIYTNYLVQIHTVCKFEWYPQGSQCIYNGDSIHTASRTYLGRPFWDPQHCVCLSERAKIRSIPAWPVPAFRTYLRSTCSTITLRLACNGRAKIRSIPSWWAHLNQNAGELDFAFETFFQMETKNAISFALGRHLFGGRVFRAPVALNA